MIDLTFIRPIIEQFYEGVCTISVRDKYKDERTGITHTEDLVTVYENVPCRLSNNNELERMSRDMSKSVERPFPTASHQIRLFVAPELDIPAGSHIEVTQHGITQVYGYSGIVSKYCTHQEVCLEIWDKNL